MGEDALIRKKLPFFSVTHGGPLESCLTLVKQLKRLNANVGFGERSGRGVMRIIFRVCYDPHDGCLI